MWLIENLNCMCSLYSVGQNWPRTVVSKLFVWIPIRGKKLSMYSGIVYVCVCMCVCLVAQSCPTLCHSHIFIYTYICYMHTLSHAKCLICMLTHSSHVQLFVTSWTIACQAPLSMIFFWQEYWSGLPCPPPGDLPNPEIELASLASHVWWQILYFWATWEATIHTILLSIFSSRSFSTSAFPSTQNAVSLLCHCINFHSSVWPFTLFNVLL